MGYTHFWYWKQAPDPEALQRCVADMAKLVRSAPEGLLAGWEGKGRPKITPLEIGFNGRGPQRNEPFIFPGAILPRPGSGRDWGFNFTKTERKPYDPYVTACLLVATTYFVEDVLLVKSNGKSSDWKDGQWIVKTVLGVDVFSGFLDREEKEL